MYSVLLVDDEKIIREGVYELLSMADLDLELTMAASAVEAQAVLEQRKIDIVLMDICMPQMTGLDLFDVIREKWPYCKVIFLTGYLEFDYVYKVHKHARYVLKAEEDWKIVEAVRESIAEIEGDLLLEKITVEQSESQRRNRYYERKLLLKELVDGYTSSSCVTEELLRQMEIEINLQEEVYYVMLRCGSIRSMDYSQQKSIANSMGLLIEKYYMDFCRGTYFDYSRNLFYLLLQPKRQMTGQSSVKMLVSVSELFQKAVNKNLALEVSVFVSGDSVSFYQALADFNAVSDKMLGMSEGEIKVSNAREEEAVSENVLAEYKKQDLQRKSQQLEYYFENLDREAIRTVLDELQTEVQNIRSMHDLFVLEMYCSISARLLGCIKKLNLTQEIAFRIGIKNLYNVSLHGSWQEAFGYLKEVAESIFTLMDLSMDSKNEDVVNKVKSYVISHLDGDTSLYALSVHVHLSPEYLLRVFKKKEGITILQYINDLRLAEAKRLLKETDMQTKEIAGQLGFTSAGYFGRFFKSRLGITPNAYREKKRI